jgi:hypothetical protein
MKSIEDHTPVYKSPIVWAGCFCLIAGLVLMIWSLSALIMLGGSMLFGIIAGVLGYQRQSVVLILFPLIIFVSLQIYLEVEIPKTWKEASEEFQLRQKTLPKISVPGSQKFDR